MQSEGKLVLAGQAFDTAREFWGILIVNASDPEAANAILNADPAVAQKLLRGEVIPFRTVVPRAANPPVN